MALKKDKQKVLGETFSDDRVRGFLEIEPRDCINTDYLRLERAYRSMNADNFTTFVQFFVEANYDINAQNPRGLNLLQEIQEHHQASEYRSALKAGGAKI